MTAFSVAHARAAFGRERARARHHRVLAYVIPVVPPVVAVTLFSDVMGPAADVAGFPTASFADYMAPGAVLLSGMMLAGFTAVGVAEDERSGFADRLRLLGVSPLSVTTGRLAFEAGRVLPAALAAYALAVLRGDDLGFSPLDALALLAFASVWTMAYNALFHLVAHRTANPHAPLAMQPLFAVLTFPSTFWYPRQLMPAWGRTMTDWSPMSWLTDGARAFTTGGAAFGTLGPGVAVIVLTGIGLGVAIRSSARAGAA